MGEEGIQRVPLTSDGSETETEPCAEWTASGPPNMGRHLCVSGAGCCVSGHQFYPSG